MTFRLACISTLAVLAALIAPATGSATSGGASTGGATPTQAPAAPVTPGGFLGGQVTWRGTLSGAQTVRVERLDQASGTWTAVATVPADENGDFTASWLGDALGSYTVRAEPADGSGQPEATTADAPLTARVTVFRSAKATWYGPGFYGKKTACGTKLTHALVGVAHRKLACGTPVQIFYKGRSLVVPVVDRGPFAHGASYDLTQAAATALGFETTDKIGVVTRPAPAS